MNVWYASYSELGGWEKPGAYTSSPSNCTWRVEHAEKYNYTCPCVIVRACKFNCGYLKYICPTDIDSALEIASTVIHIHICQSSNQGLTSSGFMYSSRYVLQSLRSQSSVMWPPYMISPNR